MNRTGHGPGFLRQRKWGEPPMPRDSLVASSKTVNGSAGTCSLRCFQIVIGSVDLDALKISARKTEFSLSLRGRQRS
jgi:hypothetical protein